MLTKDLPAGVLQFCTENEEYLRFEPGGKVYVRGELIDDNQKVYIALIRWLSQLPCPNCGEALNPEIAE